MAANGPLSSAGIDALWDYGDPAASEPRFRALSEEPAVAADPALRAEVLTQLARTHGLRGQFQEAHQLLDEAQRLLDGLPASSGDAARARLLLERGRCLNSAGDPAGSVPLFAAALDLSRAPELDYFAVDAVHMLGIADEPERRVGWNRLGLQMAAASADERTRRWQGALHNNLGWVYHDAGRYPEALEQFEAGWAFRRATAPDAEGTRIAKWTVARCLRSLGRTQEALALQQELAAECAAAGKPDRYVYEEIGECLAALGDPEAALPWFGQAQALAGEGAAAS